MEDLNCILSSLDVPTPLLKTHILQAVLLKIRKLNVKSQLNDDYFELHNKILQALWSHLHTQVNEFDDQLLCSTCFYAVLGTVVKQHSILNVILQNINEELSKKNKSNGDNTTIMRTISIIYGMFQSNYLTQRKNNEYDCILKDILHSSLNLLIQMAYEYSHYTFIVFKIIVSFKKIIGTDLKNAVFTKHNQLRLLNLVNHNWENPINGIRNLNKSVLQTIVLAIDNDIYKEILNEIHAFYWNKAKYLMFSEIIDQYRGNIGILIKRYNLMDGLLHSLHKPGLVSAGADMYYSVIKKINSDEEWKNIFLNEITQILNNSSQKPIENFNNYWCLTTLRKFPSVGPLLLDVFQNCQDLEPNMFTILCVMKQTNKLNLIEKCWNHTTNIEKLVLHGIKHCNPYIRMLAIDIVCVSHGQSWPGEVEYEILLNFLSDNVNSDCTVLRLSMLNSLSIFLSHIQMLYLNNTNIIKHDIDNLLLFCSKLQDFIITSLDLNGNYQRKITTVKIIGTVLNCFTDIPNKRQKQLKQTQYTLIKFLTDHGHCILISGKLIEKFVSLLSDPADDVRENVMQLLLKHYKTQLKQPVIVNQVIDNALLKLKSRFFYEINCGKSMFKLVINFLLKEMNLEGVPFKNLEEIFDFAFTELRTEYNLKRDIVESIEKGKQLHSNMCILSAIFEVCLKTLHTLQISKDTIWSLLEILEGTSNQFAWEQGASTSPDFSQMGDMVKQIIEKSGYTASDKEDHTKITGLEKIVLNSLFLNAKVSCELAAFLIQYYNTDMYIDICEKSLYVITKVLETSRHKGAIEAAGVALGASIHNLTSLPLECQLSKLPISLLKKKLKELILESNNMASVTRRGAGLSIMVHRIPLFHFFIITLLDTCKTLNDDSIKLKNMPNVDNEKDLPKAVYIHFLTRIVTDSSLVTEVMYYSAKLSELAFDNLTSSHWQIRNAALQLYGALIPKLMGQRKASGSEDEVTATVACDEFRTHFPQLWMFILNQLKVNDNNDILQSHSNLMPILNILGNMAKRYNFSNNLKEQYNIDNELLKNLTLLLGSPIYTVRRLTAKCIFNIYSIENIFELLVHIEQTNENYLHGCILLLVNCYNFYKDITYHTMLDILKNKFRAILQRLHHSYLSKELLENIFFERFYKFSDIQKILFEMKNCPNEPGIYEWANTHIRKHLQNCSWADIPWCLQLILDSSEYEKNCETLYTRLNTQSNIDYSVLIEIANILLAFPKKMVSCVVWKILYKISFLTNLTDNQHIDIKAIIQYVKNDTITYKLRFILPFIARITTDEGNLLVISKTIQELCNAEMSDIDMRKIAATANNEIAIKLNVLPDEIKIISVTAAIVLLQDEDEDVRNMSVHFYKNITKMSKATHPYICLLSILNSKFLRSFLSHPRSSIISICQSLSDLLCSKNTSDGFNLFENESKNIYKEDDVVYQLMDKLKVVDF